MRSSTDLSKNFTPHGVYTCPVCHHGQISTMPLMEAFGCNFCRHIFTANFEKQLLVMADSQLPLTWRWKGGRWKGVQQEGLEIGWCYLVAGFAFVVIPTTLVGLGAYLFPTIPGTPFSWLPACWTGLTFLSHLACLGLLVIEYYQFPVFIYFRAIGQRLLSRE